MTKNQWISILLICAIAAAGTLAAASVLLQPKSRQERRADTQSETETWFEGAGAEAETEDFDFGLAETWIDLNDQEYAIRDKLKCYLFIGTDHSGNEKATDETYHGSMGDFLLVAVLNQSQKTYGFIQLNRDTITEVPMLDELGDLVGTAEEQLCTAHWYGGSRQQSCLNMEDAVSDVLGGLDIDGYYSVGMDEIAKLNHVIGGATVTIEDDFSETDPSLVMGKTVTLTDEQAYHFLHDRLNVGDGENTSRMRRQKAYMEAVYEKVIDRVKAEKNFLEDITDTLGESVTTDMNGEDFAEFRDAFREGESLGIQSPDGETMLGSKLGDGLEHTEFYMDESSLADIMIPLCNLQKDEFSDWNDLETETELWE